MKDWGSVTPNLLDVLVFDRVAERLAAFDAQDWGATFRNMEDEEPKAMPVCQSCYERRVMDPSWGDEDYTNVHRRSDAARCLCCGRWVQFMLESTEKDATVSWIHRLAKSRARPTDQIWLHINAALALYFYSRTHLKLTQADDWDLFVNDVLDLDLLQP